MTPALTPSDILRERARRLARADATAQGLAGSDELSALLIVRLAAERIGLALDYITEVHRTERLTPVPGASAPVVGVIAWRGRVLTVLDIATGRSGPVTIAESTRIVVIGQRRAAFGIVADEVDDVESVNLNETHPVETVDPARAALIRGVTRDAIVVLDVPALIARYAPTH